MPETPEGWTADPVFVPEAASRDVEIDGIRHRLVYTQKPESPERRNLDERYIALKEAGDLYRASGTRFHPLTDAGSPRLADEAQTILEIAEMFRSYLKGEAS